MAIYSLGSSCLIDGRELIFERGYAFCAMQPLLVSADIYVSSGDSAWNRIFQRDTGIVSYALPLVVIGGGFSLYHTVLQKLPHDSPLAACGPVSCQGDYLNWFGFITIPMLALAAFLIILTALLRLRKLGRH